MDQSHLNFRQLLNNLEVGVFRLSPGPKGRFVFVNAVLAEMLGFSGEEVLKGPAEEFFENRKAFLLLCEKIARQGSVKGEEVQLVTKNKKVLRCSLSGTLLKEGRGKPEWVDGIVQNATIHKKIERDLAESKELFKTVFTNSAVAIVVTDKEEKIIAWNPFAEKVLSMTKEDLFNKNLSELHPSKEWQRIRTYRMTPTGILVDIETQAYKKDRTVLDVSMSISAIKDVYGNIAGSISILRDITKQKIAEQRIKESENKVRVILDNSPAAITLTDEQERIVLWNKFAEELLQKDKEGLYLKPVSSLYPEEEWKKIRAANIRKKGSQQHFETKIFKKNGELIDISLSVNILKDSSNNIIGSVGVMQEITEQKKMRHMLVQAKHSAEEANKSKSLFLANMSHEVRTPMNTVMGMLDITLDTELADEQRENLKTAKDAADNLLSLLNDILDLSRVEAGKINLEMIELNVENIVKSVCKGLSVLAAKKTLEIIWEVEKEIPPVLVGDPLRVRQILVNLINNAIKFTFKGHVQVKVKCHASSEKDCELLFSVRDEGIGIPKDKQGILFNVFTQADESTTRRFGGTGLGLAICKKLVEMMGGKIWVESEDMKGSTFYFTAKFKTIQKREEVSVPAVSFKKSAGSVVAGAVGQISILLAEDNIVNQKIAVKLLEKKGWLVKAVDDGQKVLDLLAKENFDVILMDAQMPVLDGFETTRKIRDAEKKTGRRIPIIALTARAMNEDKKKCLDVGMDGYVPKPIDRENLYETIETIMKKGSPA